MNRRELLQAVSAFYVSRKLASKKFQLKPDAKYVIFFDPKLTGPKFGADVVADHPNVIAYALDVPSGQTIDDAIRIFKES